MRLARAASRTVHVTFTLPPFGFAALQVTLASRPGGPWAPCGPVAPWAPVAPVAPVAPSWPAGPAGPVGPLVAIALVTTDDLELARRITTDAIDKVRALGSAAGFATLSHLRAWANYRAGRLVEAIADAQSVLDGARYGWEPALPAAHAVIALSLLERGDTPGAETALELPGGDERWMTTFTWNDYVEARGELRLVTRDAAGALADFEECGRGLAAVG